MTILQGMLTVLNLILAIAALCVSTLAIWLSLKFYFKSSDMQRDTSTMLIKLETLMSTAYQDLLSMVRTGWETVFPRPNQEQSVSEVIAGHPEGEKAESVGSRIETMRIAAKTWEEWYGYEQVQADMVVAALHVVHRDVDRLQISRAVQDLVMEGIATSSDGFEIRPSSQLRLDSEKLHAFRARLVDALLRAFNAPPDKDAQ